MECSLVKRTIHLYVAVSIFDARSTPLYSGLSLYEGPSLSALLCDYP